MALVDVLKNKQTRWYLGVGITSFVVEYSLFVAVYGLSHNVILGQTVSFLVALMVSFYGNRKLTFGKRSYGKKLVSQVGIYAGLAICNLILSNVVIYVLVELLHVLAVVAKLIVIMMIVSWNYIVYEKIIFKEK